MRPLLLALPVALVGLAALPSAPKGPPEPTYAHDVAPILNRSCVPCHTAGEVAPFSLSGYDNAKKWGAMAATVTKTHQMPPWKAAPGYGEFQHENRLSDDEIATLTAWAAAGAPRGDRRQEPAPPMPPKDGWTLGKPDYTVQAKGPYHLGAEGGDVYRNFVVHNPSEGDLWVRAMDVHPGDNKVVHHVLVYIDGAHAGAKLAAATHDGQEGYTSEGGGVGFIPSGVLGGWAPGSRPYEAPDGIAFRVPAGADLVMQVHYHKSGKPEEDATQVGLYTAKAPVHQEVRLAFIANPMIALPAGQKAAPAHLEYRVPRDITIRTVMPHMHLLGRTMRAKIVLPDGTERPLIDVPDWDFNWQLTYALKEPMRVPTGSKIVMDATYDNSKENPRNPSSPPKTVRWGESTTDEMFLLIAGYTRDAERL